MSLSFPISSLSSFGLGQVGGGTQAPALLQGVSLIVSQNDAPSGAVSLYPWSASDPSALTGQVPSGLVFGMGSYAGQIYAVNDAGAPVMIVDNGALVGTLVVDSLDLGDSDPINFGDANDIVMQWNGTNFTVTQAAADSSILWGVSGAGINHVFYGDTAGRNMTWDQSADQLLFADSALLSIGSGAGGVGDVAFSWDGTRLNVTQLTANSEIRWGVDGAGMDQRWYGDTASAAMVFDQSLDALTFEGAASIRGIRTSSTTAAAITGATVLTLADSGGVFSVSQAAAYDIDLPSPTSGPGCRYQFYLTGPAANNVTITVTGGAATFVGTINNAVTSVLPATGATLTFASGTAVLGDNIEIISISTGLYLVRAFTSAAGGITIS